MIFRRLQFCISGLLLILPVLAPTIIFAQKKTMVITSAKADSGYKVVIAGPHGRSHLHETFFGKHYRREWVTPVTVPVFMLDTLERHGLKPYQRGGGRQSMSLRLHDLNGREYVLRSVDKSFARALDPIYQGTFIARTADDQVSISHPYATFTIPQMAEAARIYHANPRLGYVPAQDALDSFRDKYGDYLYMLEQRPDGNWETANNFGNATKIISTENMREKLLENHASHVDQLLFVRSRLFDMFIGDWSRHDDQWRWGVFKSGGETIYKPIPRDRDQAYSKFDGILPRLVIAGAHLRYLQSFDYTIKNVKDYGFTSRHLDRRCANEVTLQQWTEIANDLQQTLTDKVIEDAVRQMPPEVFPISGPTIIEMLKSRRDHLVEYAKEYYLFLARHVDVVGSKEREYFDVRRINDNETSVRVFGMDANGAVESEPSCSRVFKTNETKDIRLYGIAGNDRYVLNGKVNEGINVTIIGGPDKDAISDNSFVLGKKRKTIVYDDWDNEITPSRETKLRLSKDSAVHEYDYKEFQYHQKFIRPLVSYDNPDRVFVSIGYAFYRHRWRKDPYGFEQAISLRYSFTQNALSLLYKATFYQAIGKWNLNFWVNYDAIRWTNFFGLGNETPKVTDDMNYYRLRTNEINGGLGLYRILGNHRFDVAGYSQAIAVINDQGRLAAAYTADQNYYFEHHEYLTGRAGYTFTDLNDKAVPEKGVVFYAGAAYTGNMAENKKGFATYNGNLQLYVPLIRRFSLSVRTGAQTVVGTPEFYQFSSVGGPMTIRGFVRDRFWGNTAFYDANELRYITNIRSYLVNGKIGLFVLYDVGRVWYENEVSHEWHSGYGGGIMLAPFNRFTASTSYAQSSDGGIVQFRVSTFVNR
jgi:hypothetical protein